MDAIAPHLFAFVMGVSTVGSGIARQNAVSVGAYTGVVTATAIATASGLFGTRYVSQGEYGLYASFSAGCLAVALWMAYNSAKKINASAGLKRAAGMLIVLDEKILGVHRGEEGWALPVVKLRSNEDFVTAAHRAVLDETGWTAKLINEIQPFSFWEEKDGYLIQIFIAMPGIETTKKIKQGKSEWIDVSLLSEGKYGRFNEKMLDYFSKYR
jgi:ADP-ribose pyrophosphatase YjhB (NUDIX family)